MAKLLLVDNDARIVELVALFLGRRGHDIRTANSYAEARALLAQDRPDLVLADLDLGLCERSPARRLFLRDRRPELYGGWLLP